MKPVSYEPAEYAIRAARRALENEGFGVLLQPGMGKTAITLMTIDALKTPKSKAWLLIVPLRPLYFTWPAEIAKWLQFNHLSIGLLHGPRKGDVLRAKHDIYAINPEGLPWLAEELNKLKKWPFDKLVIDESTKFKNPSSVRFGLVKQMLSGLTEHRKILTGTIMSGALDDIWSQIYILDHGARLGRYVTHFRREYMVDVAPKGAKYSIWRPHLGALFKVSKLIADITITLDSDDYLRMPKVRTNDIFVDLPPRVRKIYKDLETNFFAQLAPNVSISAALGSTKGIKLRQITDGLVYVDSGDAEVLHTAKVDALLDLIEEQNGEPLLVQVSFVHEARYLQAVLKKALGMDIPYIGAGISPTAANKAGTAWNSGQLPVLLANAQSLAHGSNLQSGGCAVLWFSMTYSGEDYEQFNARLNRQGQKKPVVIHRLLARNTIDSRMVDIVEDKNTNQKLFKDYLKE